MIFSNKVLYKGEILFTKYIPIIISLLYLCNTLYSYYYKEIPEFSFLGCIISLKIIFNYDTY